MKLPIASRVPHEILQKAPGGRFGRAGCVHALVGDGGGGDAARSEGHKMHGFHTGWTRTLAALLGLALSLSASGQTYTFVADQDESSVPFDLSNGLSQSFARNVATIDPLGVPVSANELRRDRQLIIAAVPPYEHVFNPGGQLYASGVDRNGTTPLMIYLDTQSAGPFSPGRLFVFKGGVVTPQPGSGYGSFGSGETNLTYVQPKVSDTNSIPTNPDGFLDLLNYTVALDVKAFQPRSFAIFHGIILAAGPVWVCTTAGSSPKYELKGWGFAVNQNQGSGAWTLWWDDVDDPHIKLFHARGEVWSLHVAPIYQRGDDPPTQCVVTCSDYLFSGISGHPANSGRAYYFRIERTLGTGGNPHGDWDIIRDGNDDAKVKVFDIWPGAPDIPGVVTHVHSHGDRMEHRGRRTRRRAADDPRR